MLRSTTRSSGGVGNGTNTRSVLPSSLTATSSALHNGTGNGKSSSSLHSSKKIRIDIKSCATCLMVFGGVVFGMLLQNYFHMITSSNNGERCPSTNVAVGAGGGGTSTSSLLSLSKPSTTTLTTTTTTTKKSVTVPSEFYSIFQRATLHQQHCNTIGLSGEHELDDTSSNNHTAHLSQFGILNVLENMEKYTNAIQDYPYQCTLPPEMECSETQFTVIFMAYNPDRLKKLYNQIIKMTSNNGGENFKSLVHEIVIVWNGEREVEESKFGQSIVNLATKEGKPVRIVYPLKHGFVNDLMNRYHPSINIQTKAIMYYDDDGPFYSYKATLAGFELWKRNSNAQIGAMARKLDLNSRQQEERRAILNGPGDKFFISHCPTDSIRYNFNEFANFGANMVLPSGSFLHSNYLCFLWHPLFEEIRQYVRQHPVNPDDHTVSAIVAQLSGRAPKVYSRRINESKDDNPNDTTNNGRRRLMDGINWDDKNDGKHKQKQHWGKLRSDAANSLIRYFGTINSGSIGWCYGTPYQTTNSRSGDSYCQPEMAKIGYLPWMNPDHTPKDTCP